MLIRKKHDKTCNLPPRYAFTLRKNPLYQKKKKIEAMVALKFYISTSLIKESLDNKYLKNSD